MKLSGKRDDVEGQTQIGRVIWRDLPSTAQNGTMYDVGRGAGDLGAGPTCAA